MTTAGRNNRAGTQRVNIERLGIEKRGGGGDDDD